MTTATATPDIVKKIKSVETYNWRKVAGYGALILIGYVLARQVQDDPVPAPAPAPVQTPPAPAAPAPTPAPVTVSVTPTPVIVERERVVEPRITIVQPKETFIIQKAYPDRTIIWENPAVIQVVK